MIIAPEIIGIAGGLLILVSWLFETIEAVEHHKSLKDLRFAAIYIIGILLLAFYSASIGVQVFFWLNVSVAVVVVFEIWYAIHIRKVHRRRR